MEEIGVTYLKYQPLRVLWHPCMLENHGTHNAFTHLLDKQTSNGTFIVSSTYAVDLKFIENHFHHFSVFTFLQSKIKCTLFFPFYTFIFITHFFVGLHAEACVKIFSTLFLFIHCQITHSFLNGFQPDLCQHMHFPHVCSTYHTIFSLK